MSSKRKYDRIDLTSGRKGAQPMRDLYERLLSTEAEVTRLTAENKRLRARLEMEAER